MKAITYILFIALLTLTSCVTYTDVDRFDNGVEVYQAKQGGIYEIDTIP